MKKITNQLIVGSICMVLAFLITVQIKTVNKRNVVNDQSQNNGEILVENEHLKKQKRTCKNKLMH